MPFITFFSESDTMLIWGGAYLKTLVFLKNDNKEMLTIKQKHVKNVIHCLVLVGKIPRRGAYLGVVLISIFVLGCGAYSGAAFNQVNTVYCIYGILQNFKMLSNQ